MHWSYEVTQQQLSELAHNFEQSDHHRLTLGCIED